jgi:hypothetical protein
MKLPCRLPLLAATVLAGLEMLAGLALPPPAAAAAPNPQPFARHSTASSPAARLQ